MGCDIHAVFQAKRDGRWIDIPSKWEQDRHYFLFSWLADVRNGFGFAGSPTYTYVVPLAKPRGLPEDFAVDDWGRHKLDEAALLGAPDGVYVDDDGKQSLGDHSHSWLTADEILAATPPGADIVQTGVVTIEEYRAWDGNTPPGSYCGGISGRGVRVAETPAAIDEYTTHVRISWMKNPDELAYFVDEVRRLRDEYGEVRLVFGFDS